MLKRLLYLISLFFILTKYIKVNLLKWGYGETFIGYLLLKIPKFDFTKMYFSVYKSNVILVTGTNGKTSTTSLLTHILNCSKKTVLTNTSGSNLERGVLSSLVLSLPKYFQKSPDYIVLEVDEASVPNVLSKINKNSLSINLIVLNLSRDQLDRYGEVDILAKKINNAVKEIPGAKVFIGLGKYSSFFQQKVFVKDVEISKLAQKLNLTDYHLKTNLSFIYKVLTSLGFKFIYSNITPFNPVGGRGRSYFYKNTNVSVHLTKNPASFNNNLKSLKGSDFTNVLVYLNDNIPDGRDVSWFYDIDYSLIKESFYNKNIYLCGSRSYDFYNFLQILGIKSFNNVTFINSLITFNKYRLGKVFVLSNYSATQQILSYFKSNV